MKSYIYLSFLLLAYFFACKQPKVQPESPTIKNPNVIVLNEGGFTYNNSDISIINTDSNTTSNNVFYNKNKKKLGDVLQSVTLINQQYFWVLNNSNKIVITDSAFNETNTLTGLISPRYIYNTQKNKIYVSDLYANKIAIVILNPLHIHSYIKCAGWTENFTMDPFDKNYVWVSNKQKSKIYKIDCDNDLITDSISTNTSPNEVICDKNKNLWVSCDGNSDNKEFSSFIKINLSNKQKTIITSKSNFYSSKLTLNSNKDTLYWLDAGVKKMSVNENTYPETKIINADQKTLYGLSINPKTSEIWISDAKDYVQNGTVYRYSSQGTLTNSYNVGLIPNGFLFK